MLIREFVLFLDANKHVPEGPYWANGPPMTVELCASRLKRYFEIPLTHVIVLRLHDEDGPERIPLKLENFSDYHIQITRNAPTEALSSRTICTLEKHLLDDDDIIFVEIYSPEGLCNLTHRTNKLMSEEKSQC